MTEKKSICARCEKETDFTIPDPQIVPPSAILCKNCYKSYKEEYYPSSEIWHTFSSLDEKIKIKRELWQRFTKPYIIKTNSMKILKKEKSED